MAVNGNVLALLTSSLDDLSWRGGVAGDAWLSRSGRTLLVRVPGVPRPLLSPPAPLPATPRFYLSETEKERRMCKCESELAVRYEKSLQSKVLFYFYEVHKFVEIETE